MRTLFRSSVLSVLMVLSLGAGEVITIRHMWTYSPVENVLCVSSNDTLCSDNEGRIMLSDDIIHGDSLSFHKPGYFDRSVSLRSLRDFNIYLIPVESTDIIMSVQPAESESRMMLPAHTTRITVSENDAMTAFTVGDMLKDEAGILVKSYGSSGQLETISLRGMGAEQTQVLVDGIPANSMQNGSFDLGLYPLMQLSDIDVYRGAHYLFGGSGSVGGTVNLIPKAPAAQFGMRGSAGYASFGNRQLLVSADLPAGHFRQQFYLESDEGRNDYSTLFQGREVKLHNRDFVRTGVSYHSEYRITPQNTLGVFASNTRQQAGSPKPFVSPNTDRDNRARMTSDLNLINVKYSGRYPFGNVRLQMYVRNEWMTYADPSLPVGDTSLHSIHFNQEKGTQLRWRKLWSGRLLLMAGSEFAWFTVQSSDAGKQQRERKAAYLLGDWVMAEKILVFQSLHLNAGSRLEDYSDFGTVFLPSAGITGKWTDGQVYVTAGRNYRAPTFNDLYWFPGGNPDLKPERSDNVEIGMNHKLKSGSIEEDIKVSGYFIGVDQQIKWIQSGDYWTPRNILNVVSRGAEVSIGIRDLNDRFRLHAGFSYGLAQKNRAEFQGDHTVNNRLPYIPVYQWNMSATGNWRSFSSGISAQGMGSRFTTLENRSGDILPAHMVCGAWFQNRQVFQDTEVRFGLSAENVFNDDREMIKGYPFPGRTFRLMVGIGYR